MTQLTLPHSTDPAPERRTVRIPSAEPVGGWRQVLEVTVPWVCPACGGPRGEVCPTLAHDGRHPMHVDAWDNPCGHLDLYADVEREAHALRAATPAA